MAKCVIGHETRRISRQINATQGAHALNERLTTLNNSGDLKSLRVKTLLLTS